MPGDKSIAHRGLILGAMQTGRSTLRGELAGADVVSTAHCLQALGCEVLSGGSRQVIVRGVGWRLPPSAELNAGNSGTTMRLLAGALAGQPGRFELSGDASLSTRPMGRVAEPLRQMGARVELDQDEHPPMIVSGGSLKGIRYALPVASAQVKGAVLLAGLQAEGTTTVTEIQPSRDHTERLLGWLGARVQQAVGRVEIAGRGNEVLGGPGFALDVPGDLSSAAFLIVAACLCREGSLEVRNAGLNPTRTGILEVLKSMGANLTWSVEQDDPEPRGRVRVRASSLNATTVTGELIPRMVDELPLIALAGTQASGTTVIAGAGELRLKESDRISVLGTGLRTIGADVEEHADGLVVRGPTELKGGTVDSHGDHRMALTFAVAGLIARDPVIVKGWECSAISYPSFERDLLSLAGSGLEIGTD